jgi:hypothetical protein
MTTSDNPAPLTKLVERCGPVAISHGGCGDLIKPVWQRFESKTGEVTKVNMASIAPITKSGVSVMIYTYLPGSEFNMASLRTLYFTCKGKFADSESPSYLQAAPPNSVVGTIARNVCPIGNKKKESTHNNNARVKEH